MSILPKKARYRAVGVDRDVGRELVGHQRRPGRRRLGERRIDRKQGLGGDRHADRDDQRAAALEERAAGEIRGLFHFRHDRLPQPIIDAARLTARRMFMWVPQRHLSPPSACLICCVGGLLVVAQEGRGRHDPAVDAVAALRHLLFDIGGLQRMRLLGRSEPGHRHDLAVADGRHRRDAGADRLAVQMHGAGAALREPAAELRDCSIRCRS